MLHIHFHHCFHWHFKWRMRWILKQYTHELKLALVERFYPHFYIKSFNLMSSFCVFDWTGIYKFDREQKWTISYSMTASQILTRSNAVTVNMHIIKIHFRNKAFNCYKAILTPEHWAHNFLLIRQDYYFSDVFLTIESLRAVACNASSQMNFALNWLFKILTSTDTVWEVFQQNWRWNKFEWNLIVLDWFTI